MPTTTARRPVAAAASWSRDVPLVVAGSHLVAAAAQVSIPTLPVPFTLQTVALLVVGIVLGSGRGAAALTLYLLAGAAGLPVFQGFAAGPQVLFGPTAGYLLAFVPAAWLVGLAAERGWCRTILRASACCYAATLLVLAGGFAVLGVLAGPAVAWNAGVAPFLFLGLVKSVLAAAVAAPARAASAGRLS